MDKYKEYYDTIKALSQSNANSQQLQAKLNKIAQEIEKERKEADKADDDKAGE
jgi:uncharacterized protein YdcH (DUF465 family)